MQDKTKIFIIDDHYELYLKGKYKLLLKDGNIEVDGTTEAEISNLDLKGYNAILLDIGFDEEKDEKDKGLKRLPELTSKYPNIPVIMLTVHQGVEYLNEAFDRGAFDYIIKRDDETVDSDDEIDKANEEIKEIILKAIRHNLLTKDPPQFYKSNEAKIILVDGWAGKEKSEIKEKMLEIVGEYADRTVLVDPNHTKNETEMSIEAQIAANPELVVGILRLNIGDDDPKERGYDNIKSIMRQKHYISLMVMLVGGNESQRAKELIKLRRMGVPYCFFENPSPEIKTEIRNRIRDLINNSDQRYGCLFGNGDDMKELYAQIEKAANSDSNVYITGGSGTGKELVAWEIYRRDEKRRGSDKFAALNLATLTSFSTNVAEGELQGCVENFFHRGSKEQVGVFERGNGGVVFLDEILDATPDAQKSILRIIQERKIRRLGGKEDIPIDFRLITASNRNIEYLSALWNETDGKEGFRPDLAYRINVMNIEVPALKDHKEDIPILLEHFAEKLCLKNGLPKIKVDDVKKVIEEHDYDWPGNIRQLENFLEKCLIECEGPILKKDDVDDELKALKDRDEERAKARKEEAEKKAREERLRSDASTLVSTLLQEGLKIQASMPSSESDSSENNQSKAQLPKQCPKTEYSDSDDEKEKAEIVYKQYESFTGKRGRIEKVRKILDISKNTVYKYLYIFIREQYNSLPDDMEKKEKVEKLQECLGVSEKMVLKALEETQNKQQGNPHDDDTQRTPDDKTS